MTQSTQYTATQLVGVRLTKALVGPLDEWVALGKHDNRSEAIEYLIRTHPNFMNFLRKRGSTLPERIINPGGRPRGHADANHQDA